MIWHEMPNPTAAIAIANIEREERRARGIQSRIDGERFEQLLAASLDWYQTRGTAFIEKTPEPMKPIGKPNRQGQFKACYTKAGQPDFKGTVKGGRAVVFEAKHTGGDRIDYDRLTLTQVASLTAHDRLGAAAFVMVSFRLENFYRIPWAVWRDMKKIYGRKYLKEQELTQYRVKFRFGAIMLLEGLEGVDHE